MTRFLLCVTALALAAAPAAAQSEAPPPHLSIVEGRAELTRGTEREPAQPNTPLVLGDQLRTDDGRAEVLLGDGSALHLDAQTTVDFNGDTVVRLTSGRAILITERGGADGLQVDTAPASVRIQTPGEVHLALYDDRGQLALQVAVVRGWADVDAGGGAVPVRAGQQVVVREGEQASYPAPFNSARLDAFTRWSMAVLDSRRGTASAQYLPADVRVYGPTFDQHGSWSYADPYGYVWYPRVEVGWRPYYRGRWRHSGRFGWTFVGYDPWGWATHHYGRWGLSAAGAWFWIPRSGWSPAWVHWAVAPGYVGWCPLGWNNRPVLAFWGHGRGAYAGSYRGYRGDPFHAWSVVPVHSFRRSAPVHRQRFDPSPFRSARGPAFVVQPTPPNVAVARGAVVAPAYRVAGPSVAPRAGQSRRGTLPAASGSNRAAPRAGTPASAARSPGGRLRSGDATPAPPAVIYHRGAARQSPRASGATAYDRAGVAVPRGLPADVDSSQGGQARPARPGQSPGVRTTSPGVRTTSPYGRTTSPYAAPRGRTPDAPSAAPPASRPEGDAGDHPAYAVSRGGQLSDGARPPAYRATDAPRYRQPQRAPEPSVRQPEYRGPAAARPRGGDGGSQTPARGPAYRAPSGAQDRGGQGGRPPSQGAGPSRGQAAPRAAAPSGGRSSGGQAASPRSSQGRSSQGTASPRRR